MAKYLLDHTPPEQALQKVEKLMNELGITLTSYGGLGFTARFSGLNEEFWLQSTDSGERSTTFPRMTEDERLVLME